MNVKLILSEAVEICSVCKNPVKRCELCKNKFETHVYCYKVGNTYKHFCSMTCVELYVSGEVVRGTIEIVERIKEI